MPISRPLLIALFGVVLIGAAVLLTRGGGDDAEPTASVTPSPPEPLQAAEPEHEGASEGAAPRGGGGTDPVTQQSRQGGDDVGGGSGPAGRSPSSGEGADGVPQDIRRALDRDRIVVVFLYQPGAADDEATLRQVHELEAARDRSAKLRETSAILSAPLSDAAKLLGVSGALGVSRAPAIAILQPNGEVRVVEGYTDGRSLRQHLTDALR